MENIGITEKHTVILQLSALNLNLSLLIPFLLLNLFNHFPAASFYVFPIFFINKLVARSGIPTRISIPKVIRGTPATPPTPSTPPNKLTAFYDTYDTILKFGFQSFLFGVGSYKYQISANELQTFRTSIPKP